MRELSESEAAKLREIIAQILMHGGTVNLTQALRINTGDWPDFGDYINHDKSTWTVTEKGKQLLIRGDT